MLCQQPREEGAALANAATHVSREQVAVHSCDVKESEDLQLTWRAIVAPPKKPWQLWRRELIASSVATPEAHFMAQTREILVMLSSLAKSLAEGKTFAGGRTGAADPSQGAAGVPANGSNFFVMATGQVTTICTADTLSAMAMTGQWCMAQKQASVRLPG
eukprot:14221-Heterococcus_DN1.PRE.4